MKNVFVNGVRVNIFSGFPYGQGLFAKRDLEVGEHIAYYSGFTYNDTEFPAFPSNLTDEAEM